MNPDFFERLDSRVRDVESSVRGLRAELDAARAGSRERTQPEPAAHPVPPPERAPEPVATGVPTYVQMFGRPMPGAPAAAGPDGAEGGRTASPRPRASFETVLAGRAMPIAGMLLVLLAAAFFLDQAFRNGWIGPRERILLGLVVGSVLIFVAARRIGPAYVFLAEGLIGLGAGILYLSLWAAVATFPELHVSRPAAFAAMIAVTAVLSVLASTRRSERLALMGMFGGFITPVLLANGPPDRTVLAAYLLILAGALLWVSVTASFRIAETLTFVAVACYAPAFAIDPAQHWNDVQCAVVATLFFAAFAIALTLGTLRDGAASNARIVLLTIDTAAYAFALELAFGPKQTTLGIILLVLAAVLLATARAPALAGRLQVTYGYLGLAAVTLAIPALFHALSLIDVFAVEAALLVAIGTRGGNRWLLIAAGVIFACTGLALLERGLDEPPHRTLFNPLSLAFAVYLASLAFALMRFAASGEITRLERNWRDVTIVGWNLAAVGALSRECADLVGGPRGFAELTNEAQFGLSAIWTIYASALFGAGLARGQGLLRWMGLALFGITIVKVFVVDLASLVVTYRILSFLVLGVVLVAASTWYQRAMVRQKAGAPE